MKNSSILFLLGILLVGCGDLKSPRDVLQTRTREQINERLIELRPIAGEYEGTLLDARSGQNKRFKLYVVLSGKPYEGVGIPEETTAPTLMASALVYVDEYRSENYITVPFGSSDYDTNSGRLSLFSETGTLVIYIDSSLPEQEALSGRWSDSVRGHIGDFSLKKTKPLN